MDIQTALAELKKAEGDWSKLSDEARAAVMGYEPPDTSGLLTAEEADSRAARARRKAEKERDEIKAQLEELTEQAEELRNAGSTKKSDAEKQVEKLTRQLEKATADLDTTRKAADATARQAAIESLGSRIKWMDGVAPGVRETLLKAQFAEVETDDLRDASVVDPIAKAFTDANPSLIQAGAGSGAGAMRSNGATGATGTQSINVAELMRKAKSDPDAILKSADAMFAGVESGAVTLE